MPETVPFWPPVTGHARVPGLGTTVAGMIVEPQTGNTNAALMDCNCNTLAK